MGNFIETGASQSIKNLIVSCEQSGITPPFIKGILWAVIRVKTPDPKTLSDSLIKSNAAESFSRLIAELKNLGLEDGTINSSFWAIMRTADPKKTADSIISLMPSLKKEDFYSLEFDKLLERIRGSEGSADTGAAKEKGPVARVQGPEQAEKVK